jgi:hypothetical protein
MCTGKPATFSATAPAAIRIMDTSAPRQYLPFIADLVSWWGRGVGGDRQDHGSGATSCSDAGVVRRKR